MLKMICAAMAAAAFFIAPYALAQEPAEAPGPIDAQPIVIGDSLTFTSAILGETREINIWLPAAYESGDTRYPALYVIDGGLDQDFEHIAGLAQYGEVAAMFRPMIVVGVKTIDRQKELTSPVDTALYKNEFPTHGEAAVFRAFITDEVIPMIDARYRTNGETAVIGESLAGLLITEIFLKSPSMFDHYIAISPSVWWDEGALGKSAEMDLGNLDRRERSVYFALANEGPQTTKAMKRIVSALEDKKAPGLRWTYSDRPDLEHSTIYHREALEGLVWTFPRVEKE